MMFKKFIIGVAIAVAGVAAWAASDTNAFKADEADATTVYEIKAYGSVVGYCSAGGVICYVGSYITYEFPGCSNYYWY
ncbi:MAG: hypothetical protein MJ211_01605 [Bacteroidales bacterium]|nr:hypothetical protein [Bacteroidales bacterium]